MQYVLHLEAFSGWQGVTDGVVCPKHHLHSRYHWSLGKLGWDVIETLFFLYGGGIQMNFCFEVKAS